MAAIGFQEGYVSFIGDLRRSVEHNHSQSIIHFGDGDYYLLTDQPLGSARPGRRAISRRLSLQERTQLAIGLTNCTCHAVDLSPSLREQFKEVAPSVQQTFPTEYIYAAVASRRLTHVIGESIGLIGAEPKLRIIEKLMQYRSYQSYLGLTNFLDYIPVNQKFAADDPRAVVDGLTPQLEKSRARLFLVGMGSAKMGVLHRLPRIKDAVYLDVGSGIDALAGLIDPRRPYFADWINFRLSDPSGYHDLDLLQLKDLRNTIYAESDVLFAPVW